MIYSIYVDNEKVAVVQSLAHAGRIIKQIGEESNRKFVGASKNTLYKKLANNNVYINKKQDFKIVKEEEKKDTEGKKFKPIISKIDNRYKEFEIKLNEQKEFGLNQGNDVNNLLFTIFNAITNKYTLDERKYVFFAAVFILDKPTDDNFVEIKIGTTYLPLPQLMIQIKELIKKNMEKYDSFIFKSCLIKIRNPSSDEEKLIIFGNKKIENINSYIKAIILRENLKPIFDTEEEKKEIELTNNRKQFFIDLLDKYILYSPSTYKNCLINAVMICKYFDVDEYNEEEKNKKRKRSNKESYDHKIKNENKQIKLAKNKSDNFVKKYKLKDHPRSLYQFAPFLCEKTRCNIEFTFSKSLKKYSYKTEYDSKTIKIIIIGSHSIALLPKTKKSQNQIQIMLKDRQELIKKPKENKKNQSRICVYDIETCDSKNEEYDNYVKENGCEACISRYFNFDKISKCTGCNLKKVKRSDTHTYAIGFYNGSHYTQFFKENKDDDVEMDFLNFLATIRENSIIYGHNGGKFDLYQLIKKMLLHKKLTIISILQQNNRIINCVVKTSFAELTFRDSMCFINSSLAAACDSYKTDIKKLDGDVDHESQSIHNTFGEKNQKYVQKYLKYDCLSLYQVLDKLNKNFNEYFKQDIRDNLTNASIARSVFLNSYYDEEKYPIYRMTNEIDAKLRKFYYGGRNEAFNKLGIHKGFKWYYHDFTSLYPSCQGNENFGYGRYNVVSFKKPIYVKEKKDLKKVNYFGFVNVKVKNYRDPGFLINGNPSKKAYHGIYKNNKFIFPKLVNWTDLVITTEELKYSVENDLGYEYQIIDVINYKKKGKIFEKVINDSYKMKLDGENEKNPSKRSTAKIIYNSLYGLWGIILKDRVQIDITKINQKRDQARYEELLSMGKLKEYNRIHDYNIFEFKKDIFSKTSNVGVSFMIASYARTKLYNLIKDVSILGGDVYYCDTDSIISNINLYDTKLCKKYFKDKALGYLTNESGNKKNGFYTDFITLGCKSYFLSNNYVEEYFNLMKNKPKGYKLLINDLIEKTDIKDFDKYKKSKTKFIKFKGVNKNNKYLKKIIDHKTKIIEYRCLSKDGKFSLAKEDYEMLARGYVMKYDNMSFTSSCKSIMLKNKSLSKLNNEKTCRCFYDKGQVLNKKITLLEI